jgi:hypothetical protein
VRRDQWRPDDAGARVELDCNNRASYAVSLSLVVCLLSALSAPDNATMVQNLWFAARSVFAVVAGIVVMAAVAFAIEIPLRLLALQLFPQMFPDRAALDTSVLWIASQVLYTIPALMLGGFVTAWLAPRRGLAHAVAMAIVQELLIVMLIFNPPHPVPPWVWPITLLITPAAIIYGGYLRSRRKPAAE